MQVGDELAHKFHALYGTPGPTAGEPNGANPHTIHPFPVLGPKRPEWSFQFRFLRHSFVYVSHLPLHAMCPAYLVLPDLITLRIFSEQYK
jgi:hypothetical protein